MCDVYISDILMCHAHAAQGLVRVGAAADVPAPRVRMTGDYTVMLTNAEVSAPRAPAFAYKQ